jgi:hypothetical protein
MAGNLVKKVMLKIVADDGDSEEKLDRISEKADELGRKHPEIKVRVDAAAASAKVAVLRRELKDAGKDAEQPHHFSLSGIMPAIGEMSMFQKVMLATNIATTFAEPLMAGLTVVVGGLTSALAAGGIGLGAYGLALEGLIKSGYKPLTGAISGAKKEWESWSESLAKPVAAPVIGLLHQVPGLLKDITPFAKSAASALTGLVHQLSAGLQSSGFQDWLHSILPEVKPVITGLGQAIGHIVVGIGGIIKAFAPVGPVIIGGLDKITARFAHWGQTLSSHSGFKSLMTMFKTETPLAVGVLKNLGSTIMTIVKDMTGLSGVGNSKFLLQMAMPFTSLLRVLVQANPALVRFALYAAAAGSGIKKISNVFGTNGLVGDVQSAINVLGNFGHAAEDAGAGEKIAAAATRIWEGAQAGLDAVMDANPIALIVIAVVALIAVVVLMVTHLHETAHIFDMVRHAGAVAFDAVRHAVATAFDWIKGHWPLLLAVLTGPIGMAVLFIVDHWHTLVSDTHQAWSDIVNFLHSAWSDIVNGIHTAWSDVVNLTHSGWSDVINVLHSAWSSIVNAVSGGVHQVESFFSSLPGRIVGFLASLPGMLFSAGVHAMEGLISGLGSMIGKVGSVVSGIAGKVAGFFGLSPAREGPLSGGGAPFIRGQHFAADFAAGMVSGHPGITSAAAALAGATGMASRAGAGGAGQKFTFEFAGGGGTELDHAIWEWFVRNVRVKGGGGPNSVQRALGQGT